MKKIYLFLSFLAFSVVGNAQTLLSENFDALGSPITLPSGWEMLNLSSPVGTSSWFRGNTASFSAYEGVADAYIAVNYQSGSGVATLNNWLMSPAVTVQNGDEVSFYSRVPSGSTWPDRLELRMSVDGSASTAPSGLTNMGSYTTTCVSINPSLTSTGYPQVWTKYTYTVAGLSGQVSCRFALRYHVTNGGPDGANSNYVGVDSFKVRRPVANDLSLNSVAVASIIPAGNYSFQGVVENIATNTITAYDVTWQANGGAINTYNVTGVNIAPGATHNFTHNIPLNAMGGQTYSLTFNVSSVNGTSDPDTSNNSKTANTQVATGTTAYKPMLEKFTGSTCAPCASYNNATFNPYYTAENQNFNYVAYQMNWPTNTSFPNGDPYYTAEGGTRRAFYGVNAITSLWINGVNYSTGNNQAALTTYVNNEAAKNGYFLLTANRDLSNNTAVVNYNITPYLSGTYTLHAAVIEKLTTGNVGTNGETSFKHVMMKMVPNASGTSLNLTAGTPVSGQITASLTGTNIEEVTDLEVILFIQDPATKQVMQSYKATDALSVEDQKVAKIKVYPNPAQNYISLTNIDSANILITDATGKSIMNLTSVNSDTQINVSNLVAGIYFVTLENNEGVETIKFIKK